MEEIEFKIQDIFEILKRQWKLIGAIAAGVSIIAALVSFFVITPIYQVDSKVFIGKEENSIKDYDNNDVQMYQKLLKTYSEVIKTKDLIQSAISKNNLDITSEEVIKNLKITPMTDTQILEISYENKDKTLAKEVLVVVIDEFMRESKEIIPNGNVQVIESAELPQNPISPNKGTNIAIAFLVGIMIGVSIAFLREYVDDTLKTKEQTEKVMELPVIGMIPCEEKN
ncbi:capsular polysaccharide biosynthesis protein [Clostridium gelidum]|uniref:Capsular polysaccharide biosynthesis protein n=1 Tax=Clostridium gelidum TaxID=704125 RepID=A0ABN6J1M9_9CLOT|nr:Wzz/FepE/Etk N-terminal domain-containing protein [Clostridium gelidum]BCZ47078.1 capsular polysaccharide biosynthesis protein [Clostridium gelidum]